MGSGGSCFVTLVERHSRYLVIVKVANRKSETVVSALIDQAKKMPTELYKSLTWDRGLGDGGPQTVHSRRLTSLCTSVIRRVPGNADRTKTPMGC